MEQGEVTARSSRLLRFSLSRLVNSSICCAKLMPADKMVRLVCENMHVKEKQQCPPALGSQSILSVSILDLHYSKQSHFDRWLLMVSGASCFSQLTLMRYPQIHEPHRALDPESINYFPIEKEISGAIMLLRQLILFQQRNVVCWKYTIADREPNPVIGFTLSHNLRSVHF